MHRYRAVILDIDGTLIDSNRTHAEAWAAAFGSVGIAVRPDDVQPLVGKGGDKLIPDIAGVEADSETGKQIAETQRQQFFAHFAQVQPFPQVRAFVEWLQQAGYVIETATSGDPGDTAHLLERAGVADLLRAPAEDETAGTSKPDPDVVLAALERAGVPASAAVLIGDTPYDIESAVRAGVDVIGLRCGGWGDADLAGALAVYDDIADLLAHHHTSPLAG